MEQLFSRKHTLSYLVFVLFFLLPFSANAKNPNLVFFDFDSHLLSEDSKSQITDIISANKKPGDFTFRIIGHADLSGGNNYNHLLSRKRARVVKNAIALQGIPRENIEIIGMGEHRPIILTANGTREARNRRVEVQISDASEAPQGNGKPIEFEERNHWLALVPFLILFLGL